MAFGERAKGGPGARTTQVWLEAGTGVKGTDQCGWRFGKMKGARTGSGTGQTASDWERGCEVRGVSEAWKGLSVMRVGRVPLPSRGKNIGCRE
jgi:hypothetical protein